MPEPTIKLQHRILVRMLLPVLAAGLVISVFSARMLSAPLAAYLNHEADQMLGHAAEHGLAICDNNLNYLLELRLEDDAEMARALQHEAIAEILAVHDQLPKIDMLVLGADGTMVASTRPGAAALRLPALTPETAGAVTTTVLDGVPVRLNARYFPFWRWYVVSLISEKDYTAPVNMALRLARGATLGVTGVLLLTLIVAFGRLVARPLKPLITAAHQVAAGRFAPVAVARPDEIGRLADTFNAMVAALERTAHQNRALIEALQASEERFRAAFETGPDALVITQMDDQAIVAVNDAFCRLTGYTRREAVGRSAHDLALFVDPRDRERLLRRLAAEKTVRDFQIPVRAKDGTLGTALISTARVCIAGIDHLLTIARDVTQQAATIQALSESEARYRALFEYANDAIMVEDFDDRILDANRRACAMLGYSRQELLTLRIADIQAPEVRGRVGATVRGELAEHAGRPFEGVDLCKDGTRIPVEVTTTAIADQGLVLSIVRDISDRKRAEAALKESEEKYRLVVENASDAILVVQEGRIRFVNQQAQRLIAMDRMALLNGRFIDLVHPEDRQMVLDRHAARMAGKDAPRSYAFRILRADGEVRWGHLSAVMIEWDGKPATLNFMRDTTTEKRLEDQFQQAQRLEGIGTLAGGIAHDFNNLLMGIQGNALLARTDLGEGHTAAERLRHIERLVENGVTLTRQLLGFARGGKYQVRPTDMNRLLKKHNQMFGRTKKEIRTRGMYEKDLWAVAVDRGQMEQVLMNLYINAWQAMPGGGNLKVATGNVRVDASEARANGVAPGRYVRIDVKDSGIGMDAAVMKRIFDPFFTTKDREWGTGLGLASVYGIIKNHGGFITVASQPGQGAAFSLFLPATDAAVQQVADPPRDVHPGHGTVLVVDDEEMILEVTQGLLERLGYQVLLATSGHEALERLAGARPPVDVVLLDMIMPDMGGGEAFDRIRQNFPQARVILSSGYSISGQATEIMDRGCDGFIQKPFGIDTLSAKLQEVLGKPPGTET